MAGQHQEMNLFCQDDNDKKKREEPEDLMQPTMRG